MEGVFQLSEEGLIYFFLIRQSVAVIHNNVAPWSTFKTFKLSAFMAKKADSILGSTSKCSPSRSKK